MLFAELDEIASRKSFQSVKNIKHSEIVKVAISFICTCMLDKIYLI